MLQKRPHTLALLSWQAYEPVDKLPLYGQDPINAIQTAGTHYVATGDGKQGITGGTIAGKVISDQILGISNPWTKVGVSQHMMGITPGIPDPI